MITIFQRHPHITRSVWRRAHQAANPRMFPTINVNEFPKSGGTWLCRMLRDALGWRFDDNRYPWFGPSIIKHHRIGFSETGTVTVVRDPRDVAISYFHHCKRVFSDDGFNKGAVSLMARSVFQDCASEAEELEAFINMLSSDPISPAYTWGQFYDQAKQQTPNIFRYEDLSQNTAETLQRVLAASGNSVSNATVEQVADSHDISKIVAARKGQKGAFFVRSGKVGGWKDILSETAREKIEADAGPLLKSFGYA